MTFLEVMMTTKTVLCGGTLVAEKWVITVAHCFSSTTQPSDVTVYVNLPFNVNNRDTDSEVMKLSVTSILQHPSFDRATFNNDIALLELAADVQLGAASPRLGCLPEGELVGEDVICVTTGWGTTSFGGPSSDNLREVQVRTLPWELCDADNPSWTDNHICAGKVAGVVDSCQGDSGGPLMCQRCDSCAWQLAGIVSSGVGCGSPNSPGLYTRVSYFEGWIYYNTDLTAPETSFPTCT
ncbi:transmembrane protease serine 11D-like [Clavelina lepadiformis]|uniref:transmembrane protease serine 11D-like n=1 Tax=Clavelina lepadiformis TaxID=159417 RepID=UPI004042CA7A